MIWRHELACRLCYYISFISRYAETMDKLDEIDDEEMNNGELLYYMEVMARINEKLLAIS